jgi:hypothetical protein
MNSPNGLELNNVTSATVEELREKMLPMWPKGVAHQEHKGHYWRVRFTGSPWDSKGHESILYVSSCTLIARYIDLTSRIGPRE